MEHINNWINLRDLRKQIGEGGDCTVVAISAVLDIPYLDAHLLCKDLFKRKKKKGVSNAVWGTFKEQMEVFRPEVKVVEGPYNSKNKITINQFCKKHPNGAYLIGVRGHALAIIDGNVYDHSFRIKRQVNSAWRVYREGELKK